MGEYGELAIEVAPLYYKYGSYLFHKAEIDRWGVSFPFDDTYALVALLPN